MQNLYNVRATKEKWVDFSTKVFLNKESIKKMFVHGEPKITHPPHVILKIFNIQLAYFTLIMQLMSEVVL